MEPEKRLVLALLLLALAERDESLVRRYGQRLSLTTRKAISFQAITFVSSGQFDHLAELVGVPADLLRKLAPLDALSNYDKLMRDDYIDQFRLDEIVPEEQDD